MGGAMPLNRSPARSFEDLLVWRKAHEFVLKVYKLTSSFPKHETFGLSSQMRRAAVSIAANIAEGFRKRGKGDKARFMNTAEGSTDESHYYLILAWDLCYADAEFLMKALNEVSRLLNSYTRAILEDARSEKPQAKRWDAA
jgi:four helix bundle protein